MEIEENDVDPNFEPQPRLRSNTWPLRPREFIKEEENRSTPSSTEGELPVEHPKPDPLGLAKKTSSRRNAWGNLSYADLITKAVESSPEKRLTLSQIYDWMVQNVPYFKDKGESNSSAGWKNSIRHNLSLHSRFMRVQNEGTGKSSWWVINPDAKTGKTPRRRATSMDTKTYEKKRGRVKKKVDALRAELHSQVLGSDLGDSATELNLSDSFNLSPQDFRARTSSNASSIGGRLSPIQAGIEPDSQVPPMSPISWGMPSGNMTSTGYTTQDAFAETLSQSLSEMFVGHEISNLSPDSSLTGITELGGVNGLVSSTNPSPLQNSQSPNFPPRHHPQQLPGEQPYMTAPPPYADQMRASPQQHIRLQLNNTQPALSTQANGNTSNLQAQRTNSRNSRVLPQTLSDLLRDSPPPHTTMSDFSALDLEGMTQSSASGHQYTTLTSFPSHQQRPQQNAIQQLLSQHMSQPAANRTLSSSLLRQALTQKAQLELQQQQQQQARRHALAMQQSQTPQPSIPAMQPQQNMVHVNGGSVMTDPTLAAAAEFGPFTDVSSLPADLVNFSDSTPGDLECDVDQVIKHERSLGASLDINFESGVSEGQPNSQYSSILT